MQNAQQHSPSHIRMVSWMLERRKTKEEEIMKEMKYIDAIYYGIVKERDKENQTGRPVPCMLPTEAVTTRSDPFGGLEGYLAAARGPGARGLPQLLPAFANGAGAAVAPGDATIALPSQRGGIPTSSARPGKRTNDAIPYTRVVDGAWIDSLPSGGQPVFVRSDPISEGMLRSQQHTQRTVCASLEAVNSRFKLGTNKTNGGAVVDDRRGFVPTDATNSVLPDTKLYDELKNKRDDSIAKLNPRARDFEAMCQR